MSNDRLDAMISKARALCTPKADKMLNSMKGTMSEGKMMDVPIDKPDYSGAGWDDDELLQESGGYQQMPQYAPVGPNNTRMPKQIIEEMMRNPIDVPKEPLDQLADKYAAQRATQQKPMVMETAIAPIQGQSIDYSVLRAIINECIDSKLKEYLGGKQSLNESSLKGIKLSEGTIKLVDNSGRMFSAKLEYTGKVKNNK